MPADATDQDPGAIPVAKGAEDALGLPPAADKLRGGGDRHAPVLDIQEFLVTSVRTKGPPRAARRAESTAAARAGIDPSQMPMPPAALVAEMEPQQGSPALRRRVRDGAAGGQLSVESLGKADRVCIIDRPVSADCVLHSRSDQRLDKRSCGGTVLPSPACGQEYESRLLFTECVRKCADLDAILASFRSFEADERFAFDNIAMAREVKRLERPILRDPLPQELDRAALFDHEVESEALCRLQDRGFLLLVTEYPLSVDFGRHEQQR